MAYNFFEWLKSGNQEVTKEVNSSPKDQDVDNRYRPSNLPNELVMYILEIMVKYQRDIYALNPIHRYDQSAIMALYNVSLVNQLWGRHAQALLFRHVVIETQNSRDFFHRAVDPSTERGQWLGEQVVSLTISYWEAPPSVKELMLQRVPLWRQGNIVEQMIQRCTKLTCLKIERYLFRSGYHAILDLWISDKLKLPPSIRHLEIHLINFRRPTPSYNHRSTSAIYKLLVEASKSSVTTLRLGTQYKADTCPPLPPPVLISPNLRLHEFHAYRLDELSQLALQHSKETLKVLSLINPSHMQDLGRTFPHVTHLRVSNVAPGDSIETFENLEVLYWFPSGHMPDGGFLDRLPRKLRLVILSEARFIPVLQTVIDSGTHPNLQIVAYRMLNKWEWTSGSSQLEDDEVVIRVVGNRAHIVRTVPDAASSSDIASNPEEHQLHPQLGS